MVEKASALAGVRRRRVSGEEIRERCLFALVDEGARILEEGIADAPGDIDVIWTLGYGFPSARGGPMYWARRTVGLPQLAARLDELARIRGDGTLAASSALRSLPR